MIVVRRSLSVLVVLVAVLGTLLLSGKAEAIFPYDKTWTNWHNTGVTLAGHSRLDVHAWDLTFYGVTITEASQRLEAVYARNSGAESCNYQINYYWDTAQWQYSSGYLTVTGNHSYHPYYSCNGDHEVWVDSWWKWRNWTWSPPISFDWGRQRLWTLV
jgi:hypothetical protein